MLDLWVLVLRGVCPGSLLPQISSLAAFWPVRLCSLSCVSWPQAAKVSPVSLLVARLPCNRTHCLLLSPFFHQIQLCLGKRQCASSGQEDKKVARGIGTTPTSSSPFTEPVRPVSRKGKRCGAGVYPAANRLLVSFVFWLTARIVALHSYYWCSYHRLTWGVRHTDPRASSLRAACIIIHSTKPPSLLLRHGRGLGLYNHVANLPGEQGGSQRASPGLVLTLLRALQSLATSSLIPVSLSLAAKDSTLVRAPRGPEHTPQGGP
jgi:hypothetical protein